VRLIFSTYDTSGDNSLNYEEFLHLLRDGGKPKSTMKLDADTELIVRSIRRKLEDHLGPGASSARRIKETFAEMDHNRNGRVDKTEFERAMAQLRVELSRADLSLLFERFDPDRNGLDYKEFLELLNFAGSATAEPATAKDRVDPRLREDTDAIVARIRRKLEDYLGPGASSAKKIKETFADIDHNRNGTLDKNEFEKAMSILRVDIARADIAMLFQRFDTNRNGLDYKEFLDLLNFDGGAGQADAQLKDDTDAIAARIRRKLEDYLGPGAKSAKRVKEAFAEMDRNRSGTLDKNEFEEAMRLLRVDVSRADVALLYQRFDTDRNGLDYKEFLDLLNFGGSGINKTASPVSKQLKEDASAVVRSIRRKLEDYLGPGASSARRVKEAFAEIDRNRNGLIDKNEFERAMRALRVDVSRADVALLFERYDRNRNGLDYSEFIELIGFSGSGERAGAVDESKHSSGVKASPQLIDDTDAILNRVRRKLEDYLGPGVGSAKKIKEVFADIDRDNSGTIDKVEFEKAMGILRVNISASEVRLLFERFDTQRRGLNYKEFMSLVGFVSSPRASRDGPESKFASTSASPQLLEETNATIARIKRRLEDYLGPGSSSAQRMKEVFADMDRDRSGTIDKAEFTKAMSILRVDLTPTEVRQLYERFDTRRRGLDYQEFIDLIGFHSSPRKLRF
jgi:Ca2+-binding EF-hand superfamily protein